MRRNKIDVEIPFKRLKLLDKAVELEVDRDDFFFESESEQQLWEELEREFLQRQTKLGTTWRAA